MKRNFIMGILDKLFGTKEVKKEKKKMAKDFKVNGNMKVGTFKRRFNEEFGLLVNVYNNESGTRPADDKLKISEIETYKSGDVSVHGRNKISKVEDAFWDNLGLKINIRDADDKYFADNNKSLAQVKRG